MSTSIFIARLLGPLFVVVGIAVPLKTQMFRAILREFGQSRALLYLAGFLGLLGGLALVLTHNLWVRDWRLIITLIGWLTIIRALVTIFQPQWIAAFAERIIESRSWLTVAAVADLLIGVILSYFGYLA
ncbi:MAG: hypothetical protein P4L68_03505 [Methylovirgula sp.]|nr:hypothetical protein [Methylovirgula sp.]